MFNLAFRAEYIDTDAMGVVHHASYLRFFERARVEWLRSMGMSYREMEDQGYVLPLRSCELEYLKPMHFDDAFEIKVKLGQLSIAGMDLHYEVLRGGEVISRGKTCHVLCRQKNKEPGPVQFNVCRIPQDWRTKWLQLSEKKS